MHAPFAEWSEDADDEQFCAGAGGSPIDPVWRQAVRAEAAAAGGDVAGLHLGDLQKAYEHVEHCKLWEKGGEEKYPLALLRVTLRAYRWARRVYLGKLVSHALWPHRGIIAGNSHATDELKAYLLGTVRRHAVAHPRVTLTIFIDDAGHAAVEKNAATMAEVIGKSVMALRNTFREELGLVWGDDKGVHVASTKEGFRELDKHLRGGISRGAAAVSKLGVDATCGKAFTGIGRQVRRQRWKKMRGKERRLKRIRGEGRSIGRVYTSGPRAGATDGVHIWGHSPGETLALRRKAAAAHRIGGRGTTKI
jgi:hypothetical protein